MLTRSALRREGLVLQLHIRILGTRLSSSLLTVSVHMERFFILCALTSHDTVMETSAGHKIPPEIIAQIFEELCADDDKAWLTLCSLVCRHWAEACRSAIFRGLQLRSGADIDGMLQLLSSPACISPSLADSLLWINAVHRGPWGIPWIPRHSFVQPYAPDKLRLALHLEKLEGRNTIRLWGDQLPRTLPGNTFHVRRLEIVDARFRRVADLLVVGYSDC